MVDVGIHNADLRHPASSSCTIAATAAESGAKVAIATVAQPQIISKSSDSPSLYGSRTH